MSIFVGIAVGAVAPAVAEVWTAEVWSGWVSTAQRPASGSRALTSSSRPAETRKQQGLRVRMPGYRRRRGNRTRASVGLLYGFEPGSAGRDELFVQVLVRADRTS